MTTRLDESLGGHERVPFRVVMPLFATRATNTATHLLMASMAFFHAKNLKIGTATAKGSTQKTAKCTPPGMEGVAHVLRGYKVQTGPCLPDVVFFFSFLCLRPWDL